MNSTDSDDVRARNRILNAARGGDFIERVFFFMYLRTRDRDKDGRRKRKVATLLR